STLADRFIQLCGGLADREMQAQVLDSMELERERGITIKAQSVTLYYTARDGERYQLNMIDTPGHVDFSYEVSRSLAACDAALQALIIDSWFDNYVGVVSLVRVMNGSLKSGDRIRVVSTGRSHLVDRLGRFTPKPVVEHELAAGDVGFVVAGIKEIDGAPVGDTITLEHRPAAAPLPGFKQIKPRVFAGLFPVNSEDYEKFRDALAKLRLNDSALHYEPEVSGALGFGFRIGFLGLLHMDIVQERLEREYNLELVTSAPTVIYEVARTDGKVDYVDNPAKLPPTNDTEELREPIIVANILVPPDHVGAVLKLCNDKRGTQNKMQYLGTQVSLQYQLPLGEVVLDFFDRLKSASRGYASFDYEFSHFEAAPLVKLDILINGDKVDA